MNTATESSDYLELISKPEDDLNITLRKSVKWWHWVAILFWNWVLSLLKQPPIEYTIIPLVYRVVKEGTAEDIRNSLHSNRLKFWRGFDDIEFFAALNIKWVALQKQTMYFPYRSDNMNKIVVGRLKDTGLQLSELSVEQSWKFKLKPGDLWVIGDLQE